MDEINEDILGRVSELREIECKIGGENSAAL